MDLPHITYSYFFSCFDAYVSEPHTYDDLLVYTVLVVSEISTMVGSKNHDLDSLKYYDDTMT